MHDSFEAVYTLGTFHLSSLESWVNLCSSSMPHRKTRLLSSSDSIIGPHFISRSAFASILHKSKRVLHASTRTPFPNTCIIPLQLQPPLSSQLFLPRLLLIHGRHLPLPFPQPDSSPSPTAHDPSPRAKLPPTYSHIVRGVDRLRVGEAWPG